jgi:chromosomal replication initiation ATPase DnaA
MLSARRGAAEVARARQVAMYLLHTSLSIAYADIAGMFARDRTTVSHACRTIEDLRDDPMHDDMIMRLEEMVDLARSMSAAERHKGTGQTRKAFA